MTRRRSWLVAVAGGIGLAVAVVVIGLVLLRPSASTSVDSTSVDSITVDCDGIGSSEACAAWATDLLARGPGIRTFDPEDLAHVRLTRPFPLPGDCEVAWFVSRTLDEPAARETVACPNG